MTQQGLQSLERAAGLGDIAACAGGSLKDVDPLLADLVARETRRQTEKITMVASESQPHPAVMEALASPFTSLYAEGYAPQRLREAPLEELENVDARVQDYRGFGNRRYYKGAEFADLVESIAERRAAGAFATDRCRAADIRANVQALSGSAANLAIYQALLDPGDTMLAMALAEGGHLTHGSPYSITGRQYNAVFYQTDSHTEKLDYDAIRELAHEHRPRLLIGGFTSYPWAPDWAALGRIAREVGAYLLADVSHLAGLIVAGVCANPFPHADVAMFTTHKTLCGPRGAVILSRDAEIARRIDRAVFPGLQGGPHVNKIAAIAVALQIARSPAFARLQRRTVSNASALASALSAEGLRIAYNGTNTHLVLVDLAPLNLDGETAARALDRAGIVCNRNVLPGDRSGRVVHGIRLGTTWVSQWGWGTREMTRLAGIIARLLRTIAQDSPDHVLDSEPLVQHNSACSHARHEVERLVMDAPGGAECTWA